MAEKTAGDDAIETIHRQLRWIIERHECGQKIAPHHLDVIGTQVVRLQAYIDGLRDAVRPTLERCTEGDPRHACPDVKDCVDFGCVRARRHPGEVKT